jgi:hypothetical protein
LEISNASIVAIALQFSPCVKKSAKTNRSFLWGGLSAGSLLPAGFFSVENKSRPEVCCLADGPPFT